MFRTQFDPPVRVTSNPGSRLRKLYHGRVDNDGVFDLVFDGEEDLYDQIQSHAESCDIHTIMKRFEAGDLEVLSQRQGVFGDFSEFPTNYAEILNSVIAGENYFNSLPVEVRSKFNHSFREWMASMDKPDFLDRMGITKDEPSIDDPVIEPAKGVENEP